MDDGEGGRKKGAESTSFAAQEGGRDAFAPLALLPLAASSSSSSPLFVSHTPSTTPSLHQHFNSNGVLLPARPAARHEPRASELTFWLDPLSDHAGSSPGLLQGRFGPGCRAPRGRSWHLCRYALVSPRPPHSSPKSKLTLSLSRLAAHTPHYRQARLGRSVRGRQGFRKVCRVERQAHLAASGQRCRLLLCRLGPRADRRGYWVQGRS